MAACLVLQRRRPGADPPRLRPVALWFKTVFGVHALVMLVVGLPMFLWPSATGDVIWPWQLTPLTGRAMAAWLLGMGFAGLLGMWEGDWFRLRPMAVSFLLLMVFQLWALARYGGQLDWGLARTWVYLVYLLDMLVLAVVAYRRAYGPHARASG
jgi:hypothetical protein